MKEYISQWFNPFYEKHLCSKASEKPFDEVAEITDAIFHEREFIAWLKKEYSVGVDEETNPGMGTEENFLKYIAAYTKIKNRIPEKEKKEIISAEITILRSEPLAKIISDEYDINITAAYRNLKDLISVPGFQKSPYIEEYLEAWRNSIKKYCVEKNLPYEKIMRLSYPVIVPCGIPEFEEFLARSLTTFEPNKIGAMLSFQNAGWKGEELFASLVEHRVYALVKFYSPFDNSIRLEKIMNWVNKNRVFELPDNSTDVVAKGVKISGIDTMENTKISLWPFEDEKLKGLYNALLLDEKIKKNDFFSASFVSASNSAEKMTVWKKGPTELMYLFFLIYKEKRTYHSIPISSIAVNLFKKSEKDRFNSKNLNTIFNQISGYQNESKKLSRGMESIREIIESLNLK